jgi:hypothetical protein
MFGEMYPVILAHLPDEEIRRDFLSRFLPIMLEMDTDPEDLSETAPEVREILDSLKGWRDDEEEGQVR